MKNPNEIKLNWENLSNNNQVFLLNSIRLYMKEFFDEPPYEQDANKALYDSCLFFCDVFGLNIKEFCTDYEFRRVQENLK